MSTKTKEKSNRYVRKLKKILTKKMEYHYDNFSILLPVEHMLPQYQKKHVKYDRFLPHLGSYIEDKATVIDVGANCGDTLAGMVEKNPNATYVCIEPDATFFNYLETNIIRMKQALKNISVHTVKTLVGRSVTNVSLEGTGGTKHAVIGENKGGHSSDSLDKILSELTCPPVRLLKSDVDGFDYDVIDSAHTLLTSQYPMIFFECQNDFDYQKRGYEKTISWLKSIGYNDWTLFDNFGEILLRTKDIQQVFQLMNYVWKQNIKTTTRTIYYWDILAITNKDIALIDEVIQNY